MKITGKFRVEITVTPEIIDAMVPKCTAWYRNHIGLIYEVYSCAFEPNNYVKCDEVDCKIQPYYLIQKDHCRIIEELPVLINRRRL